MTTEVSRDSHQPEANASQGGSVNPIFSSQNKLKIGIFGTNGKGVTQTLVPEAGKRNWPISLETAKIADEAGYEAVVPYARWKGYVDDDPRHASGEVMDPFTWAAGIAQATKRVGIFVTSHAPTIHPIMAAKQLATIDIISNGRLGLNVVGGWNRPELEMFGAPLKEHDERYDHLAEWLQIMERLWSEYDDFDYRGRFFNILKGVSLPKPLQQPRPAIMNAGGSDRGRAFACEHADMCFVVVKSDDKEKIQADVEGYKSLARQTFGREVQVWTNAFVVQGDTQAEAEDYLQYYAVEHQDRRSVDGWMEKQRIETQILPPAIFESFRMRIAAGAGGFPLVGTADHIAERMQFLWSCGIDGILLTWVDYVAGMHGFNNAVLPQLEQMGLRNPVTE
jgi:dimethylsulfone monooxygenase